MTMNTRNIITENEHSDMLQVDNDTLLDFLKLFAQMEFRFKIYQDSAGQMPFFNSHATSKKKPIQLNWGAFVEKIEDLFNKLEDSGDTQQAKRRLISEPPKIQRVVSNKAKFINRSEAFDGWEQKEDIVKLADIVCDIRNNLFHGGKHMPRRGENEDQTRDQNLVRDALTILEKFHELFDEVEAGGCSTGVDQVNSRP